MSLCSFCKKDCRLAAKGLCGTCYARYQRNGTAEYKRPNHSLGVRECSFCNSSVGPFIKSLCRACYQQQYKTGTPERTKVTHLCEAPKCDAEAHAHGLCQRHYMRLRRHGTPEAGRPEDWGTRRKHPMYEGWKSMRRSPGGNDPAWDDFWKFFEDVGERPSELHRLCRIDRSKPFAKANAEWRVPVLVNSKSTREDRAAYGRAYRIKHPRTVKKSYLKKMYGMSHDQYDEILRSQGDGCAICKRPETAVHHGTGEPISLAVDHDHKTGVVRGILCTAHNTALGLFNEDPDLLRAAIAYLESHSKP